MPPTALATRLALVTAVTAVALTDSGGAALKLAFANRWCLWITPAAQALTLVRYRTRGQADWPWSEWITATGVAPAAGATGTVAVDGDAAYELDVEVTAAGVGTCSFRVVGV